MCAGARGAPRPARTVRAAGPRRGGAGLRGRRGPGRGVRLSRAPPDATGSIRRMRANGRGAAHSRPLNAAKQASRIYMLLPVSLLFHHPRLLSLLEQREAGLGGRGSAVRVPFSVWFCYVFTQCSVSFRERCEAGAGGVGAAWARVSSGKAFGLTPRSHAAPTPGPRLAVLAVRISRDTLCA